MKIFVLGSSVCGVTSACYLARHGHEVTVIDRQAQPALETSFANTGRYSVNKGAHDAAPASCSPILFPGSYPRSIRPGRT